MPGMLAITTYHPRTFKAKSRYRCSASEESFEKEGDMMIQIKRAFNTVFNKQYPCPQGMIGYLAGELLVRQHEEETTWTVLAADVQPADSVLEIGFGAGKAIALLAEKTPGGSVAGVDLSATYEQYGMMRQEM